MLERCSGDMAVQRYPSVMPSFWHISMLPYRLEPLLLLAPRPAAILISYISTPHWGHASS